MGDQITIQQGLPDELRSSAAGLYDAAIAAKLAFAMPDPVSRRAVLGASFHPAYAFVALRDGELVGIAGFKTGQGSLTGGMSCDVLHEAIRRWGAIRALLGLALLTPTVGSAFRLILTQAS